MITENAATMMPRNLRPVIGRPLTCSILGLPVKDIVAVYARSPVMTSSTQKRKSVTSVVDAGSCGPAVT